MPKKARSGRKTAPLPRRSVSHTGISGSPVLRATNQAELSWSFPAKSGAPLSGAAANIFFKVHSAIRADDGLHPDAALDELCKLLFAKIWAEKRKAGPGGFSSRGGPEAVRALFKDAASHAFPRQVSSGAFGTPIRLSDVGLIRAVRLLEGFSISSSPVDVKGIAFQQVLSAATRWGMGQYFTPESVVDAAVRIINPRPGERVLDPFCGSGRFLTATARHMAAKGSIAKSELHGIDRSEVMIRIAATDLFLHESVPLTYHLQDCLSPELWSREPLARGTFDIVLTNPPFGALMSGFASLKAHFDLIGRDDSVPLEFLGLEQSVRFLRPGGRLAIVLPESVLNTRQAQHVRDYVLRETDVLAVLSLPPQTFAPFGGVGKASLLFLQKKAPKQSSRDTSVVAVARDVGYDNTNRPVPQNDLPALSATIANALAGAALQESSIIRSVVQSRLQRNMSVLPALAAHGVTSENSVALDQLCTLIFTGRTPSRNEYRTSGLRILKVGDLTGEGINWAPRERSFVAPKFAVGKDHFRVQAGDILLTAAAHHPRYIGQKVDIVDELPIEYKDVLCVAELLCLRPRPDAVNPVLLLLWLRSPAGYRALQACVVGQTAHLYPREAAEIRVPVEITRPGQEMLQAVEAYRRALRLRGEFKRELSRAEDLFSNAYVSSEKGEPARGI